VNIVFDVTRPEASGLISQNIFFEFSQRYKICGLFKKVGRRKTELWGQNSLRKTELWGQNSFFKSQKLIQLSFYSD